MKLKQNQPLNHRKYFMQDFPQHLPEGCPPNTSENAYGTAYRFIKKPHTEPLQKDFLSWRELNPDLRCDELVTECQACGLSIFMSLEESLRVAKNVPRLRRMKLSKGELTETIGKIQNTYSPYSKIHYTWWRIKDTKPWEFFTLVEIPVERELQA